MNKFTLAVTGAMALMGVHVVRAANTVTNSYTLNGVSYTTVTFTDTSAAAEWTVPADVTAIDVLVVGGGGAGGAARYNSGYCGAAGGGAGAVLYREDLTVAGGQTFSVKVGKGGVGSTSAVPGDGESSWVTNAAANIRLTAGGGGHGGGYVSAAGGAGGCGGGGYGAGVLGGLPNGLGTGTRGGTGITLSGNRALGGGGGGAFTYGPAASSKNGGSGGSGLFCRISGVSVCYGGGGGSGAAQADNGNTGAGGNGGGGQGGDEAAGKNGTDGLGGGGGGGSSKSTSTVYAGGNGGSGVVIIRYVNDMGSAAVPSNLSPNGVQVNVHNAKQKEFLAMSEADIRSSFANGTWRGTVSKQGDCLPLPVTFSWNGGGVNTVRIYDADGSLFLEKTVRGNSTEMWGFDIGTNYTWEVVNSVHGASARAAFTTEFEVPRMFRDPNFDEVTFDGSSTCTRKLTGVINMRELGGYTGLGGKKIRTGKLIRTARLCETATYSFDPKHEMGDTFIKTAAASNFWLNVLGVRTQVDLRDPTEYGDNYVSNESAGPLGPTVRWVKFTTPNSEQAVPCYDAIFTDHGKASYKLVLDTLLNPANHPAVFHCSAGKDRTGTVAYIIESILGVSDEDKFRDWVALVLSSTDTQFSPTAAYDPLVAGFASYEGESQNDKVVSFVKEIGITDTQINIFRNAMLEGGYEPPVVNPNDPTVAPAIVSPNGVEVETHTALQKAFLAKTAAERRECFTNAEYRTTLACDNNGSVPLPTTLSWTGDGLCTVTVKRAADQKTVFTAALVGTSVEVDQLEIDGSYVWSVSNALGVANGAFTTSAEAPRLLRNPGSNNIRRIRDLGGRPGLGGKRVKQNLLFRSSQFNASDNTSYITDANRSFWLDELGIKTDMDLRADGEKGSNWQNSSPLGNSVNYVAPEIGSYNGLFTNPTEFKVAFNALFNTNNYPMVFHCVAGRDRTGCLAYLVNALLGVDEDELIKDWEANAFADADTGFNHTYLDTFRGNLAAFAPSGTPCEQAVAAVKSFDYTDQQINAFRDFMLEGGYAPDDPIPPPVVDDSKETFWTGAVNANLTESGNWTKGVPSSTQPGAVRDGETASITINDHYEIDPWDGGSASYFRFGTNTTTSLNAAGNGFFCWHALEDFDLFCPGSTVVVSNGNGTDENLTVWGPNNNYSKGGFIHSDTTIRAENGAVVNLGEIKLRPDATNVTFSVGGDAGSPKSKMDVYMYDYPTANNKDIRFVADGNGQLVFHKQRVSHGGDYTWNPFAGCSVSVIARNGGIVDPHYICVAGCKLTLIAENAGTSAVPMYFDGLQSVAAGSLLVISNTYVKSSFMTKLGTVGETYLEFAGDAPVLYNGGGSGSNDIGQYATIKLVPTVNWSASEGIIRNHYAMNVNSGVHYVVDVSALPVGSLPKTFRMVSGDRAVTFTAPTADKVSIVGGVPTDYSVSFAKNGSYNVDVTVTYLGHVHTVDYRVVRTPMPGREGLEAGICSGCGRKVKRPIPALPLGVSTNAMANAAQGYEIHGLGSGGDEIAFVFTNTASALSWVAPLDACSRMSVLVIGGGGAGGGAHVSDSQVDVGGGGGGAGGFSYRKGLMLTPNDMFEIRVGAGGTATESVSNNGGGSYMTNMVSSIGIFSAGGGAGGSYDDAAGTGGSGGGACGNNGAGGASGLGIGNGGGAGGLVGSKGKNPVGGGGGGAGAVGGDHNLKVGGAGGAGLSCAITGTDLVYAGGGGAAGADGAGGAAGAGGGGKGGKGNASNDLYKIGEPGKDGLGGGGGGSAAYKTKIAGGKGGDGVVIIRCKCASNGLMLLLR